MYGPFQKAKKALRGGAALVMALLLCAAMTPGAAAVTADGTSARMLVPVGHTVGIKLFARGVMVVKAPESGTPADDCGLQTGDIITAVNGTAMTSSEMVDLVQQSQVGDVLTLDVYRQGETLQLTVTVGQQIQSALPEEEAVQPTTQQSQQSQQGWEDFPFEYFFGGRR